MNPHGMDCQCVEHSIKTKLEALLALSEAASPGPWEVREGDTWWDVRSGEDPVVSCGSEGEVTIGIEDARFTATSRTAVPQLAKALQISLSHAQEHLAECFDMRCGDCKRFRKDLETITALLGEK